MIGLLTAKQAAVILFCCMEPMVVDSKVRGKRMRFVRSKGDALIRKYVVVRISNNCSATKLFIHISTGGQGPRGVCKYTSREEEEGENQTKKGKHKEEEMSRAL